MPHSIPNGLGSVKSVMERFVKAKELYELWRSLHQEAYDFGQPNRETFREFSPGQRKNRQIFDSTAIVGLQQFSNRMQSAMMPPWAQWQDFVSGDDIPDDQRKAVDEQLEEITKKFFSALNHSNFYTELAPTLLDLGIGTGAMIVEEGNIERGETIRFTNVPLAELYIEKPSSGPIDNVWRQHKIKPRDIMLTWPKAELSPKLKKLAEKETSADVDILHGMLFNPDDNKYHQLIIYQAEKALLFTQAFNTKRFIVTRWSVNPAEGYGRGPIIQQLPDIRTINIVKQFILENAAIQMVGMYIGVDDGIFNPNTVTLRPGTIIPVNDINSLKALDRAGDLGLGQFILEDLQNIIRKALFVEPLGDLSDSVRTATEMMMRHQQMLQDAGANTGRQKTEFVEPLTNAVIDVLQMRGEVAPGIKVDGKQITIKQTSPLAKSEQLEDFQSMQTWMAFNQASIPEAILAGKVKLENIPEFTAKLLGIPASLIRSEEETQQLAETIQQGAQQAIQEQGGVAQPSPGLQGEQQVA